MNKIKQIGDVIRQTYEVLNAFPFVEGVLYFTSMKQEESLQTRFIHAIEFKREIEPGELEELLSRNEEIFFPVNEVFIEDGVLYQVFEKMEGNLLGLYLLQSAPLSVAETTEILQKITNHLLQCYDEEQFALVDPRNIVITPTGEIRFLYGGPVKLLAHQHVEAEAVKKVASLLYTMLTKQLADEETGRVESVRSFRQDVPLQLEEYLMRGLSPEPDKRPRIYDFWKWAHQYASKKPKAIQAEGKSGSAESPPFTIDPLVPATSTVSPPDTREKNVVTSETPKRSFPKKPLFIGAGALVACALLFTLFHLFFMDSGDEALAGIIVPEVERDEKQAIQYFQQSNLAFDRKQLDQAILFARKALTANPEQKEYYLHLANLYGLARDYQKGKQTLEAAADKFPKEASVHDALSVHAYYLQDYQLAKQASERAVQLDGQDARYLYHQGKVYGALKQYEKAVESLRYATYISRDNARYYHDLGVFLYQMGKLEEAIEQVKKAIRLEQRDDEEYYVTLGILYLKKREQISKDVKLDPAVREKEMKNWAKRAYRAFNDALDKEKNFPEAHYYKSMAHYYYGHFITAKNSAEKATKLDPKNAVYHYQLGLTYIKNEMKEEAIAAFEKAIQLDSKNTLYKEGLEQAKKMAVKPESEKQAKQEEEEDGKDE